MLRRLTTLSPAPKLVLQHATRASYVLPSHSGHLHARPLLPSHSGHMHALARCASSSPAPTASAHALVFDAPGEPQSVLSLRELPVVPPGEGEISVRFLLSPINPSDINTVEGKYPLRPELPGVPGHEGVGEVTALGPKVDGLSIGDRVVPLEACVGTWRSVGTFPVASFHRVQSDISLEAAATLCINPPSALAMLERFVTMSPGDVVVQNGATSAVGRCVIQLAASMGLRSVAVIRPRDNWDEVAAELKGLGASVVTTDAGLREAMKTAALPPAALGLNCVGGNSAVAVARSLRDGATLVTYGGMSMEPVPAPTGLLIFKDITFRGFWLSGRLAKEQGPAGKAAALDRLANLIADGKLSTGPTRRFPLSNWQEALAYYHTDRRPAKVLLQP